jgi:cobalt/nickel transport system permease protein
LSAAIAAWLSVVVAALACAIEMAVSGTAAASDVIPAMVGIHALIALPEAAITALVITLVSCLPAEGSVRLRRFGWVGAAAIAVALAPLASSLPDGLERVAANFVSSTRNSVAFPTLFADYSLPGVPSPAAAAALACLVGIAVVYSVARLACISLRPPRSSP